MGHNPPPENQPREIDRCDRALALAVAMTALACIACLAALALEQWVEAAI